MAKPQEAPVYPPISDLSGSSPEYQAYIKREYPKGAALFQKYCAPCHGVFNAARGEAPDFSKVKIDAYNLSFLAQDSTNHAVASGISQPDFELIMLFLTYRQPLKDSM
ncbi:MAG: hypothetical protein KJS92_01115 [Bacteroidetes bacterium]|nr:hypothetical protein [Bacteroidota bacterium]